MSSSFFTGIATGSGSLTQLVATGAMDAHLTQAATETFFKQNYSKHSLFSLETCSQPFNTTPSFGGDSAVTLNRQGDLIHWQYIQIRLPGLAVTPRNQLNTSQQAFPSDDQELRRRVDDDYIVAHIADGYTEGSQATKMRMWNEGREKFEKERFGAGFPDPTVQATDLPDYDYAYYTEAIGFHLIRSAELKLGGSIVDTVWSQLLFAWEELSGKSGRRLCEQVGRTLRQPTELMKLSRTARTLYVPLPFSYTRHPSLALPLVAMQYHSLQLTVQWASLASCIIKSSQDVVVLNSDTLAPLQDSDLKAQVLTTYVQLDNDERNKFAKCNCLRQLITQHQRFTQPINGSANVTCRLTFSFPVQELIFMVRRNAMAKANDHFCYDGIMGREPIEMASLSFNNSIRFSAEGRWLRTVQPLQHHSSVPLSNIYNYSFALSPESIEPSGSANFSRIDSVDLNLELQAEFASEPAELFVFARSWNILSFSSGLAGIGFSS
jgi:hypothetical protein